ncbi:MAG: hypothetical protein H7333_00525, partial [Bdellovibrionales bacterium]|nr:hypothetical protein [Oligoflexia bacterium]
WDTQFHEGYAHLESTYNLTDALKVGLAGDTLWGSSETPLGSFSNNQRLILSLKTSF